MKICLVKHPSYKDLGWNSFRYSNPEQVLGEWKYRSNNISLAIGMKTDMWVLGDASAVPWEEYDVVISFGPAVSKELIGRYPDILWVAYSDSRGYSDLLWDDMKEPRPLVKLPQSVSFPYFTNPDIMRNLIKPTNEPYVFLDSYHVLLFEQKIRRRKTHEYGRLCGLPVKYASNGANYLKLLGSCKYYFTHREGNIRGQAAAESAALGLIVVASKNGVYHRMICHPECLMPANSIARGGLRKISKIERNPGLQAEILAYQDERLRQKFWDEPLAILERALERKRMHLYEDRREPEAEFRRGER